jgi:hypothetical protein
MCSYVLTCAPVTACLGFGVQSHLMGSGSCNDFFFLSSPVLILTMELTISSGASLMPTLNAYTREGVNNLTLSSYWIVGASQDFNYSVVAQSGSAGPVYVLRVIESPARTNTTWSLLVTTPGGFSALVGSWSPPSAGFMNLPIAAAGGQASLGLTLAGGASVSSSFPYSLALGGRGQSVSTTFTVLAEDGLTSSVPFTLTFAVPPLSNDSSWSLNFRGGGLAPFSLISATAPRLNTYYFNYTRAPPVGIDSSSLTYWVSRRHR